MARRVPPGQHLVEGFPALSASATPTISTADWIFELQDGSRTLRKWTWVEFSSLPQTKVTRDIHCVTSWSKLDTPWEGVLIDDIFAAAGIEARTPFLLAHSHDGYSTNVPVADLAGGKAMVALRYEGRPLERDHGGPARSWCLTFTSGNQQSGSRGLNSLKGMSRASGRHAAIIDVVIPGSNRGTRMTEPVDEASTEARWQSAAVVAIENRTPRIKSFVLALQAPFHFRSGQHVDLRLTAENGHIAMRSYSIGSSPSDIQQIELSIERLADGEVSPFFHDVVAIGDEVELRGPLGGHFTWDPTDGGPVLLIGAGSGVVPLVSMIRHHQSTASTVPVLLLFSARTWDDVLYRDELLEIDRSS